MTNLRAGFARRDITQPIGTPSALGLTTMVDEIWDPLSATAVVLDHGETRVALVGMDLCGLLYESHRQIRAAVSDATGIPAERVVVNSSHTHSAPYLSHDLQERLRPFGLRLQDDEYAASVPRLVAEAVVEAADQAVPARASMGRGVVAHLAGNRRPKKDGITVHRYGRPPQELRDLPEGRIDPEVAVLRFDDATGRGVGAILVYACHPTASSVGTPTIVSADFVGHGRTRIEKSFGFPCVFLQGCAGNQGTGKWVAGTPWEDTVAMGERFAAGVAAGLEAARPVNGDGLRVGTDLVPLELDHFPALPDMERLFETAAATRDFAQIVAAGDALVLASRLEEGRRARLVGVAIGDVALAVLPGEVFLEHGLAVRAGSPFRETIVAAYNDNTLQYVPTLEAFPEGEYEVNGGWRYIRPGEGERMADATVEVLRRLA